MAEISVLIQQFRNVRQQTERLVAPLSEADAQLQSMPDASPAKWHLAHTSWFFESFLLPGLNPNYQVFDPYFSYLFNSYYNGIGEQYPRERRGMISRPSLAEILEYRHYVTEQVIAAVQAPSSQQIFTLELGIHHEQQHQELLLTDIQHGLWQNPMLPVYRPRDSSSISLNPGPISWLSCPEGLYRIGADGAGFCFDNEQPRHRVFLDAFELANRPVSNREFLTFVEDDGYHNPLLWLADGWAMLEQQSIRHPLYWRKDDNEGWQQFSLHGEQPLNLDAPVSQLSYYEANAFAQWASARLPREAEWEQLLSACNLDAPCTLQAEFYDLKTHNLYSGGVWEWTQSSYQPYPGYREFSGKAGEYNGKFMSSQFVLRGGSCVTPQGHIRSSYRNFFYPHQRWQFSGLRLCRDSGNQ